jgi:hypothetical protein
MKKFVLILFLFVFQNIGTAQTTDSIITPKKQNPIIFADVNFGALRSSYVTLAVSGSLNYQNKNDLFTARILGYTKVKFYFLVVPVTSELTTEYAFMYGKRYINSGESYSFSGGLAILQQKKYDDNLVISQEDYFGFPFELNYRFFNKKRERFRIIYHLIPVGKPIAFGRSIGFKLYGNISKRSFVGIGISLGLGFHKKY